MKMPAELFSLVKESSCGYIDRIKRLSAVSEGITITKRKKPQP
jgi:hypothetical protein